MSDDIVQAVAEALAMEVGSFLAHDLHDPERFYRGIAGVAVAAAEPHLTREAKAAAWDKGHEAGWWACYFEDDEQPTNPYRTEADDEH